MSKSTIAEAFKAAQAGARILVQPGLYEEGLVLEKKLEIMGDGTSRDIVIESADSDCILMQVDYTLVRGLTLRGLAALGNNKRFAADIPQGQLVLEDCDITSDSLACVGIHGSADPITRRCQIHDGEQSGVFVYDDGKGMPSAPQWELRNNQLWVVS